MEKALSPPVFIPVLTAAQIPVAIANRSCVFVLLDYASTQAGHCPAG
jgi:hypothetical protein